MAAAAISPGLRVLMLFPILKGPAESFLPIHTQLQLLTRIEKYMANIEGLKMIEADTVTMIY